MKNNQDNKNRNSLLDMYIQNQNNKKNFNEVDEEEIANAIRTLLKSENTLEDLN